MQSVYCIYCIHSCFVYLVYHKLHNYNRRPKKLSLVAKNQWQRSTYPCNDFKSHKFHFYIISLIDISTCVYVCVYISLGVEVNMAMAASTSA